ncbi:dehydrogenase (plasmid) [Rhizobium sp. 32-5/1]|uniref:ornithine cyclodeaminase family protein n=1 Tax=Rhizobium sp. 32-5/1 TaxID=3019602 RepID=UPI00240E2E5C|nr:dehydrogenase [Rhizobium sp. 32-5/1]WEZ85466.1 dehydrogenase [Rhizobium sp. 32-5/1]
MKLIERDEVNAMLNFQVVVEALERAHRRPPMEVSESFLGSPEALYFIRNAVDNGRYMASKLITSFPANPNKGSLPAVQAVVVLFDGKDGRPLELIDGTSITHWRTSCDSALGAKILARPQSEELLIVGAGEMSAWLAGAHASVLPNLKRIHIWNRSVGRAEEVAERLHSTGLPATAVTDLDAALTTADVISACTRSSEPIIKGSLLKPGAHLDLVGSYSLSTREADDETARRSRIFVDLRRSAMHVGDIVGPLESGAIREVDILGELSELVTGSVKGRTSDAEVTLYKNAGGGHLDLMLAELIHDLHRQRL